MPIGAHSRRDGRPTGQLLRADAVAPRPDAWHDQTAAAPSFSPRHRLRAQATHGDSTYIRTRANGISFPILIYTLNLKFTGLTQNLGQL
jgi:hypothetical protein